MYRKAFLAVGALALLFASTVSSVSAGNMLTASCAYPGETVVDYLHGTYRIEITWTGTAEGQPTILRQAVAEVRGGGKLTAQTAPQGFPAGYTVGYDILVYTPTSTSHLSGSCN
jgi:hypothetical protein